MKEAGLLYERSLSLRYGFPKALRTFQLPATLASDVMVDDLWLELFHFMQEREMQQTVLAYPELHALQVHHELAKQRWREVDSDATRFTPSFVPADFISYGEHVEMVFPDADFFRANMDACARVAAVTSFYLLGNRANSDTFTVKYNPDTQQVCFWLGGGEKKINYFLRLNFVCFCFVLVLVIL